MPHCKTPCKECPFARHTEPGATGGSDPTVYIGQAIGPFLLSCHMDPNYEKDPRSPHLMQCAGAAMFRSNIGVDVLMPPFLHHLPSNEEKVFSNPAELLSHHLRITLEEADAILAKRPPHELLRIEFEKSGVRRIVVPKKT
jgi:hypothetical protein